MGPARAAPASCWPPSLTPLLSRTLLPAQLPSGPVLVVSPVVLLTDRIQLQLFSVMCEEGSYLPQSTFLPVFACPALGILCFLFLPHEMSSHPHACLLPTRCSRPVDMPCHSLALLKSSSYFLEPSCAVYLCIFVVLITFFFYSWGYLISPPTCKLLEDTPLLFPLFLENSWEMF